MWFLLALLSTLFLVLRRSTEKHLSSKFDGFHYAALQQLWALPFVVGAALFFRIYNPLDLSSSFWLFLIAYVLMQAVDMVLYFSALRLADISYLAPMIALVSVGNILGAYLILGQVPTALGLFGGVLIVIGAALTNYAKSKHSISDYGRNNLKLALVYILCAVALRAVYGNIQVLALRESNPTSFMLFSTVILVPVTIAFASWFSKNNSGSVGNALTRYSSDHIRPLAFIGLTTALMFLVLFQAKLMSPNAGYPTAVQSAQVVPMMLIGMVFFREKISKLQWLALGIIVAGLVCLGLN